MTSRSSIWTAPLWRGPGSIPAPADQRIIGVDRRTRRKCPAHCDRNRDRQEPARRSPGRGRVHRVSDQPTRGGALSGTLRPGRRQIRPRQRRGTRAHLRTDRHLHRPLPAVSDQARAIKTLARQHQEAIWALQHTVNRLRSVLLEFYPQALQAFPNLKHRAAATVLAAVPTPAAGQKLTRSRLVTLLRRAGRGNHPALVEQILADLQTPALRQSARTRTPTATVGGLVGTSGPTTAATTHLPAVASDEYPSTRCPAMFKSDAMGWAVLAAPKANVGSPEH